MKIKYKIIILILISILIGLILVKVFNYMSYTQTHMIENAKIINMNESHGKITEYKVKVNTIYTEREFDFTIQKDEYNELNKNDIIKIGYDFNDFKYLTDTVSHVYIINN